ncbi:MAG: S9 family peptidase [Draconibacterium sp.]
MYRIVFLFLLFAQLSVVAQTKQMSLEDAITGRYTHLNPASVRGLSWQDDENYTQIKSDSLVVIYAKTGREKCLFTTNELQEITNASLRYFPAFDWLKDGSLLVQASGTYFVVNATEKSLVYSIQLPEEAQNAVFSEQGKWVAFTQGDDLYVALNDGVVKQITRDGGKGIVNGQSVHRNEFGISNGIFISPKGNFIAFYRKDESMVSDYPLVDYMAREAVYTPVKYPMAGLASHHVTLGVYNIETGSTTFLKTGEPLDHFLTNVAWSPDEKNIYMAELNREQNHMQLNCYDAATGDKVKTLFEETGDTYVEPLFPIEFSKVNPAELYYLSRQDGWFHVYKYNTEGKLVQQITKGEWEVTRLLGFDPKEKSLFVEGTLDSPIENHIYRIDVKSGKSTRLSVGEGMHRAVLSPGASYVIDNWNGVEVPRKVDLLSANGKMQQNIFEAANPLADYDLGETKLVTLKTADGKYDLFGRLILPPNFDPTKKYPVVVYVYGGPHSQMVDKSWQYQTRWWQYYMASQGYIAFTMDNRGTNNRGRAFETAIHRQLGIPETEDQMQGVEYLKSLPYVDADRMGVHGWSYGGFMTLNLMMRHPEVFKVGVAGGPVVDWSMYEIMYGERYMDMPQENPEGYKESNMENHVKDLQGKLTLIHGAQDATVVMQHSMKFLRECVKQNKPVDFFAYPIHPHNVRGKDRVHLMEKVSQYFFDYL